MLNNVLARLSAMGTDYIQLNKFATHHRGQAAGLVLQAFLGAVQNYLHCYRATVLSVDGKYVYIYVFCVVVQHDQHGIIVNLPITSRQVLF